ncbi:amidohydrolase family protein [Sphingomonas jaspsi]|uniref:amidohydrolase family protein n=1 Tax=Sphingomonas jaspsi TaxID=392409 RepID=UPI0004B1DF18|nr:amidohydrolase family protein [Sphingomonas jaspsi]
MTIRRFLLALSLAVSPAALSAAPVPKEKLLVPPANADHFVIVSQAGKHGDEWRWTLPDGSRAYRESILLRGLIFEVDEVAKLDANGNVVSRVIRGVTPSGDAAETYSLSGNTANWKSPVDEGHSDQAEGKYYFSSGGTFSGSDVAIKALLEKGPSGLDLLPSGHGAMTASRNLKVSGPGGDKTIQLYFINGIGQQPQPIWLNLDKSLFGSVGGLGFMPAGYEKNLDAMQAAQDAAIAAMAPATARKFLTPAARRPILFRNVKLYDADQQRFLTGQNVVVRAGRIVSVGTALPKLAAGARVIDGTGKTLLPGLWDSHMHMSDDFGALNELALGVTSFRNPGGTIELAQSQKRRRLNGTLLAPEGFTSVIVDKAGPLAAQGSIAVKSLADTLAAVRKIKAAGMTGVKFYTSMDPAWIPPAAKLAHQLGLHVHGHIPAGMRTLDAVNAGYDEITHIYFATMQAMPADVVAKSNTTLRMMGPGMYFKDVDFNAEPMKSTIATLAKRKIVVDPTLVVVESVLTNEAGKISPAYTSYVGTVPPAVERGFRAGGLPLPDGVTRDQVTKSFDHMVDYVGVLRKAGVPIVAGTDGQGMELLHELELYVKGGMTPAEALYTATLGPAKNVKADRRTGSIAVGKEADLLLVDGDVEADVGNLRHVDKVVLDGALLDGAALRKEAGYNGMPK